MSVFYVVIPGECWDLEESPGSLLKSDLNRTRGPVLTLRVASAEPLGSYMSYISQRDSMTLGIHTHSLKTDTLLRKMQRNCAFSLLCSKYRESWGSTLAIGQTSRSERDQGPLSIRVGARDPHGDRGLREASAVRPAPG